MTGLGFFAVISAIVLIPWALLALADGISTRRDHIWETDIAQAIHLTELVDPADWAPDAPMWTPPHHIRLAGPYTTELYIRAQHQAIDTEWAAYTNPDGAA